MLTSALTALPAHLPAALDRTNGHPLGMFTALALLAGIAVVAFMVMVLVGNARSRNRPKQPPVYPILEPPNGRGTQQVGPRR